MASEAEMVRRYTCSKNVRAFCFKSSANPGWKAPKFLTERAEDLLAEEKASGSHKPGSTLCPLPRVLNLDNFLMVVMDEDQARKFRTFPKTLVVYCTQNVYAQPDFYMISVLVVNEATVAVPVCQVSVLFHEKSSLFLRNVFQN